MLVSVQCKTAGHCLFQLGGGWEHSLIKLAKLHCKTANHGPCLLWWGGWESQSILIQNSFLSPNNFHDVDHRALVLSDGKYITD